MTSIAALTIYPTRRVVDSEPVTAFDQLIAPERLGADDVVIRDFATDTNVDIQWSARLYVWPGQQRLPSWIGFLEEGFGGDLDLEPGVQHNAVIAVKTFFRTNRFFAVTFGGGRFYLRKGVIDPEYSLRVALNAIYEGDEDAASLERAERIQQVETRTVGANTMRTRRQANRSADFEEFETDTSGDQLNAITGLTDNPVLGRRVSGGSSLRLARTVGFDELGQVCRELARYHERPDYRRRFRFIDTYQRITVPSVIQTLSEAAIQSLMATPDTWAFSPPSLLDFDRIDAFKIEGVDDPVVDPQPQDILDALGDQGDPSWRGLETLGIQAIDGNGQVVESWLAARCLDGQLAVEDGTFLLEAGEFIEIDQGFLDELNGFIGEIPQADVDLPDSVLVLEDGKLKEIDEGAYNELAAAHRPEHFLLDKRTVTVPGKTSAIEICDILTRTKQLIHVKRKLSSSSLSHLFGQGTVSAELLVDSVDFRRAVRAEIGDGFPDFRDLVQEASAVGADFEVVYAIVAKWDDQPLTRIPFFSKINLRKHTRTLRRMGFKVSHFRVPVVAPPP